MSTSTSSIDVAGARAQRVAVTDTTLVVDLLDGRTITVPLMWYPRLAHGRGEERSRWRFIGDGEGIHWSDLDEDISVEGLLAGRRSGETQASLRRWLGSLRSWPDSSTQLGYPDRVSPTVLRVRGFRFYFFSREEKRPHVHVQHADGEAKFWIDPKVELFANYGLKSRHVTEAEELVEEHIDAIRAAWTTHFSS